MPVLYLAGPIDLVGKDGQVWKKHLIDALAKHRSITGQLTAFDPAAPYGLFSEWMSHEHERATFIEKVNTAALRAANVFICLLQSTKASVGTPIELDLAYTLGRRIFALGDVPYEKSVYVRNRVEKMRYIERGCGTNLETLETWMERAASEIAMGLSTAVTSPRLRKAYTEEREAMLDPIKSEISSALDSPGR